ncbi:MAG: isoleucine--tRNA ligase [Ignavibacteriota bacterium]|nr:MAG: isoleucine--tRNA ligase [Chlorobiota bacterium]MBE7476254.1 isoleucine--tRNA ligase [Ignavibacteriales bacterium]MBL1124024.1 isoleucine--tRNA ligase [Ignavibacteriota bacterium]MCE7856440.1 isoleucine--tRNA ligase [Ignavibacteria bacterium CHB3]MEB2297611.1 isoleucine--tRNA ligase [Ignavibacteria bacterium]GJQ43564.1 MAG: isoleucine--tRNA ligase [Ignavibacteriaceae bacterium]
MYKQGLEKIKYPETELEVLKFWSENKIFQKSVEFRSPEKSFTFYEGPPTANGKPGIHHVMARTLKDIVCRYKTMRGYRVERKAGWDTHGLPVEIEVEKTLGIKNKSEVAKFGVEKYNQACRDSVFTYLDLWEKMTERMGYWIDLKSAYITLTNDYIESVWWALKTLYEKDLIYKDYKIVPQDPKSETVLSMAELALGYRETKDPSVYVLFKLKDKDEYFLVWTTTPWTLISNVALAVGSDVDYVKVLNKEKKIILAKELLATLDGEYEILEEMKGKELEGIEYEQLLPYVKPNKKAFFVCPGDFVSTDTGSGIVHIAPAFGADDYDLLKKYNLPMLQPVDRGGKFTSEITDYAGQFVKDADKDIIIKLKTEGKLYKKETIVHTYPFSWRHQDVPVIYYARESWFIRTTSVAKRMIELNKTINWQPPEVGAGRFGNWLEENKDWALSRDRFWATPLPFWINEEGDILPIGSVEELKEGFIVENDKRISVREIENIDLHKPFVDKVLFEKEGKIYTRTPELIDVWFDSGAMPFAQYHYPFENKEWFEKKAFPADFICEGIDQTRGWFYTLHAIATMLFDSVAYKNLIVNELILDKNGMKMSKSKGNTVDPFVLFEKYGADATRWYLVTNSPPWRPTLFDEEGLVEVQRKFFGTLLNTYAFFALYANIDGFENKQAQVPLSKREEIDRWILSKLNSLVEANIKLMDEYEVTKAARATSDFTIDHLSNWYVRRCRRRFWKSEMNENKLAAYQTLYECLVTISKLIAPFTPFLGEELFQNLNSVTKSEKTESVHLTDFPVTGEIDKELEQKMDLAQHVVYLVRAIRAKSNLKVRQPLKKLIVVIEKNKKDALLKMKDVILEEVNIKELEILDDDSTLVHKSAKANFKTIGPKFGKNVKAVAEKIKNFTSTEISLIEKGDSVAVEINGESLSVSKDDVEILSEQISGWIVESETGVTVAVDTHLTPELISEGLAREFVNRIQNMRKDAGFQVTDKINIAFSGNSDFKTAINSFTKYIAVETLAEKIETKVEFNGGFVQDWKIGEDEIKIKIEKVSI